MNPLMSEIRILELIDEAHNCQKRWSSGLRGFHTIQFKIRFDRVFKYVWFSDSDRWRQPHRLEEIASVMFELSIRQFYISNVKANSPGVLRVTFKHCEHGRDTNYSSDTIDRLMSEFRIPLVNGK